LDTQSIQNVEEEKYTIAGVESFVSLDNSVSNTTLQIPRQDQQEYIEENAIGGEEEVNGQTIEITWHNNQKWVVFLRNSDGVLS
jgi:hypothetical protein